jgi:hypothetical protein
MDAEFTPRNCSADSLEELLKMWGIFKFYFIYTAIVKDIILISD